MAESNAVAESAEEVVPGVWHWRVQDERIGGFWGSSYAVDGVFIDPHRLADEAFAALVEPKAIVLTASVHQRSAWRLRHDLGIPVYVPSATREADEEPDVRYSEGDELPAGLQPVFTPGAGTTQHSLLRPGEPGVLFTPDLFFRVPDGPLRWVPFEFMHDPEEAKRSAERLLELDFDVLCVGHGAPVVSGSKQALRDLIYEGS